MTRYWYRFGIDKIFIASLLGGAILICFIVLSIMVGYFRSVPTQVDIIILIIYLLIIFVSLRLGFFAIYEIPSVLKISSDNLYLEFWLKKDESVEWERVQELRKLKLIGSIIKINDKRYLCLTGGYLLLKQLHDYDRFCTDFRFHLINNA